MVTLRYFPVRGRAQPFRNALAQAGIDFEDHRVERQEWKSAREDLSIGGPYQALPTLSWFRVTVAETMCIAAFLAKQLGHGGPAQDAALSVAYIDLLLPVGQVIWAEALYPESGAAGGFQRMAPRFVAKLEALDRQLAGAPFFGGDGPTLADEFVFEGYEAFRDLLASASASRLEEKLPRLSKHRRRMLERPNLRDTLAKRPTAFTSHPKEADVIATLQAADLTTAGL